MNFTGAVWYYPGSACVDLPPPPAPSHCEPSSRATFKPKIFTNVPQKPPRSNPNGVHPEITPSHSAPPSPVITPPNRKHTKSNRKDVVLSPLIPTAEKVISIFGVRHQGRQGWEETQKSAPVEWNFRWFGFVPCTRVIAYLMHACYVSHTSCIEFILGWGMTTTW